MDDLCVFLTWTAAARGQLAHFQKQLVSVSKPSISELSSFCKKRKNIFGLPPTLRRPPRPKLVPSWKVDCQEMNNFFGPNPFNNGGGPVLNLCWIFYLNVFKKVPFIDMPCIGAAIIIITIRKDCSICVMPKRSSFFRNTFQRKILQGKRTQVDAHLGNDWADEEENNNQPHVD